MKMPSTTGNQHQFASSAKAEIPRSAFDRSCGLKTTFSSGLLIPIFCDEALPGDTMNLRFHNFTRLATPLHPVIENMYLDTFFFSVPLRLVWENFHKFMGEQENPGDSTDYTIPQVITTAGGILPETFYDYLGIPTGVSGLAFSALFGRAANLIWNEWFRDENLQDSLVVQLLDIGDNQGDTVLQRRGKRKDYFTSCLPFPQKGPDVELSFGGIVDVTPKGVGQSTYTADGASRNVIGFLSTGLNDMALDGPAFNAGTHSVLWDDPALEVDLSSATANTINEIRFAFQLQRLYERDARGGTRYIESNRAHFGVISPDARLQRPEYLGGGTQNVSVVPVPVTAQTAGPVGSLGGYGTSSGSNHSFQKSFVEHSIVLGFASVRADLNYQQGLNRMFSRKDRFDFFYPVFSHIGEQAVLNIEIYAQGGPAGGPDEDVFGYQEAWSEMRYKPSQITGKMRSTDPQTLDSWHLAQEFLSLPTLGSDFIEENPPINRIIAIPSEPEFLMDGFFEFTHVRPMPTYSTPGLIDHF